MTFDLMRLPAYDAPANHIPATHGELPAATCDSLNSSFTSAVVPEASPSKPSQLNTPSVVRRSDALSKLITKQEDFVRGAFSPHLLAGQHRFR
ncbi:hypothetical protein HYDPIDRAFT_105144 [Hydnomerulius pinastri MD-312]|nr:hypothetical protein HYDPIDRAFT_105144 [Hydnomerulius pinastri MD-312]